MDIRKLQRVIVDGLEDVKAQNIVVFNTEHLSPLFERVIVASGTSNRQTKSLAASVRDAVKAAGDPPPRTEGEENGEWIIVDCGAAVVHVMQPAIRDYYHLEELWGEKPVKMKIASAAPRLVKRQRGERDSHDEDEGPRAGRPARARSSRQRLPSGPPPAHGSRRAAPHRAPPVRRRRVPSGQARRRPHERREAPRGEDGAGTGGEAGSEEGGDRPLVRSPASARAGS
jgi:ribosome-associated protein